MKKNKYFFISIMLFLTGILLIILANNYFNLKSIFNLKYLNNNITLNVNQLEKIYIPDNNTVINLTFIGDSLLASFKGEKTKNNFQDLLETHDYSFPYKNVSSIFKADDFTIANGENVFTDKDLIEREKDHDPAYWYKAKTKYANIYKESSIELVSLMNNHSYDYGSTGFLDTKKALEDVGVIPGVEEVVILEKEGVKIGLICTNLFHEFQANEVLKKIEKIKESVNYIVIYFHGGIEYQYKPSSEIVTYSHKFIDRGADLVIGCHPHVLQPIEIYKNKTIVYSLGSFIFGGTLNLVNRTIIYQVKLTFLKNELIVQDTNIIPCYLYSSKIEYENYQPGIINNPEEKRRVIDFMKGIREFPY